MKLTIKQKIIDLFKKPQKTTKQIKKSKKISTKKNIIVFTSIVFVILLILISVPLLVGFDGVKNSKWEPSDIAGFWGNISGITKSTKSLKDAAPESKISDQNKEELLPVTDETGVAAASTQAADCKTSKTNVCWINYLYDYQYLRGVNVPTLLRQRNSNLAYKYIGEPASSYDYLEKKGHKLIRLSIAWGDLQPNLDKAELNPDYLEAIDKEIDKISSNNMYTVLTLHNGGTWPNSTGDSEGLYTAKKLGAGIDGTRSSRVWKLLSDKFRDDRRVIAYELFNEAWANDSTNKHAVISPQTYRNHTNNIVQTIRKNKDTHTIWVGAMVFNGVDNISKTAGGDGKQSGTGWIKDTVSNRIMYTQHFYAPIDDAPNYNSNYLPGKNKERYDRVLNNLTDFAHWCENNNVRCSLGEVGWPGRDNRKDKTIFDESKCISAPQPSNDSAYKWNQNFGKYIYNIANKYKLDVTYFAAMSLSYPCESGNWTAYVGDTFFNGYNWLAPKGGLTFGRSQNTIIESPEYKSKK